MPPQLPRPEPANITDKEHAANLRAAVVEFNRASDALAARGIRVNVDLTTTDRLLPVDRLSLENVTVLKKL